MDTNLQTVLTHDYNNQLMKTMRALLLVLLATVLFLELVQKVVLSSNLLPPQAAVFFVSRSNYAGLFPSSHEPRMDKIGIYHRSTLVAWYLRTDCRFHALKTCQRLAQCAGLVLCQRLAQCARQILSRLAQCARRTQSRLAQCARRTLLRLAQQARP